MTWSIENNQSYEKQKTQEVAWKSYDSKESAELQAKNQQEINNTKEQQLQEANWLKQRLSVESFISKECVEPIDGVNKIVPFEVLVDLIVKSAEDEFKRVDSSGCDKNSEEYKNANEVRNKVKLFKSPHENLTDDEKKQIEWLAKDQRIYELPAYKNLIENWWFIIPSDIRTSYDSAGQQPVKHLWVDYNVKAWTPVKSIYDWEVVEKTYTWEPWESSLWYKVVVKHKAADWTEFYSLYGHLGSKNLPEEWTIVTRWMQIWEVWAPFTDENWNWEEHLHFQIMEKQDSPEWYSKDLQNGQIWNYNVLSAFGKTQLELLI